MGFEEKLDEFHKQMEVQKLKIEPLERNAREMRKKEEEWNKKQKELEAKGEEWKRLYDEVVLKFDAHDVQEFKRLKDESLKWQAQRTEFNNRFKKVEEELNK